MSEDLSKNWDPTQDAATAAPTGAVATDPAPTDPALPPVVTAGTQVLESAPSELDGVNVEIANDQPDPKPEEPVAIPDPAGQDPAALAVPPVDPAAPPAAGATDPNAPAPANGVPEDPNGNIVDTDQVPPPAAPTATNVAPAVLPDPTEPAPTATPETETDSTITAERFMFALEAEITQIGEDVAPEENTAIETQTVGDVDSDTLASVLGDPTEDATPETEAPGEGEPDMSQAAADSDAQDIGNDDGVDVALPDEAVASVSTESDSEIEGLEETSAHVDSSQAAMDAVGELPKELADVEMVIPSPNADADPAAETIGTVVDTPNESVVATAERFFISLESSIDEVDEDCCEGEEPDDDEDDEESVMFVEFETEPDEEVEEVDDVVETPAGINTDPSSTNTLEAAKPTASAADKGKFFTEKLIASRMNAFIKANGTSFKQDIVISGNTSKHHVDTLWAPKKATEDNQVGMLAIGNDGKGNTYFVKIGSGGIYKSNIKGRVCGFNAFLFKLSKNTNKGKGKSGKKSTEAFSIKDGDLDKFLRSIEADGDIAPPEMFATGLLSEPKVEAPVLSIDEQVAQFL
jgi:hypothetical protein